MAVIAIIVAAAVGLTFSLWPTRKTAAPDPPKGDSELANSPMPAVSKSATPKKIAVPNSREKLGAEGIASPHANANAPNAAMTVNANELILQRQLRLSAERRPMEQQADRYHFTLSLNVPEQTLSDISRVHYDLVYDPNPLSLEGGPAPNFSAAYEGWGCYSTVVVSVYLTRSGAQPLKKTFDMCTALKQ